MRGGGGWLSWVQIMLQSSRGKNLCKGIPNNCCHTHRIQGGLPLCIEGVSIGVNTRTPLRQPASLIICKLQPHARNASA